METIDVIDNVIKEMVTGEGVTTQIQENDIIFFCPKDGTLGFVRCGEEGVHRLYFNEPYKDKIYVGPELYDKMACWALAKRLAEKQGFRAAKVMDKGNSVLSYQFLNQ
ncbi:hypothetical protein HY250_01910 [Candidatus Azambacteria bacterium]|nr:hypothetical protein [Candidatus Azambacteria bacterium]